MNISQSLEGEKVSVHASLKKISVELDLSVMLQGLKT